MKRKKVTAVLTAAVMGVTAGCTGVWAADSYQETEKAILTESMKSFAAVYGKDLEEQEAAFEGSEGVLSLKLSDSGRVLLGNAAQIDASWLKGADIKVKVSMKDNTVGETMDICLNDQKICSIEYYMDTETTDIYMKIPEVSDSYIKMNMEEAAEIAEEEARKAAEESASEEGISEYSYDSSYGNDSLEQAQNMLNVMDTVMNITEYLPDAKAMEELLTTYLSILVDNAKEGTTGTDTVTVGDISQECTVYEGVLSEKEMLQVMQDVLTEARDDVNIKDILLKWGETEEDPEEFYAAYQGAVDAILSSVEAQTEVNDDDSYFFSKLWVDENGKAVGRQLGLHHEEGNIDPLITYQMPEDGEKFAMKLEISSEDGGFAISGGGEIKDSLLNGDYTVAVNGTDSVQIQVTDYDTESMKEGNLNASYAFSLLPGMIDEESFALLSGYDITADIKSEGTSGDIILNLLSQDVSLGELSLTANIGDGVEIPDFSGLENVCDMLDEQEAESYTASVKLDTIMDNLSAAGMPEELLGMVIGDVSAAEADLSELTEAETEDGSQ